MLAGTAGDRQVRAFLKTEVFSDSADRGEEKEKRIRTMSCAQNICSGRMGVGRSFFLLFLWIMCITLCKTSEKRQFFIQLHCG